MKRLIGPLCGSLLAIACGSAVDVGTQSSTEPRGTAERAVHGGANEGANLSSKQTAAAPSGAEATISDEAALEQKARAGDLTAGRQLLELYERRGDSPRDIATAKQFLDQLERKRASRTTSNSASLASPGQGELTCLEACTIEYGICIGLAGFCLPYAWVCALACVANLAVCESQCDDGGGNPPQPPTCDNCCAFDSAGNCTLCIRPPQVCP
jgi:hypothetical protein